MYNFLNDRYWEAKMKIGVISDTHDNVPKIEAAVRYFNRIGVEAVLHCGDFVAPFALLPFKELSPKLYLVYGNNDGEKKGLSALAAANGWTLGNAPMEVELGGKKIAMLHEPDRLEDLRRAGRHDLLLYGHTHKPRALHDNGRLALNPGEAGGWLSGKATLAVVELETMAVTFHVIGETGETPAAL